MILQRKSRDRSASELRPTQVPQPSEGSAVSATVSASPASGCAGPDLHCGNKAHRQLRWHRFPAGIAARSSNLSADGLAPAQQEQQAAEEQARQRMQTSAGPDGSVFEPTCRQMHAGQRNSRAQHTDLDSNPPLFALLLCHRRPRDEKCKSTNLGTKSLGSLLTHVAGAGTKGAEAARW